VDVLIASHLYPSLLSQTAGSFVHNQVRFLSRLCHLTCVSPTPWFPVPGLGRWSAHRRVPKREVMNGLEVLRPRYLTLPRRVLFSQVWRSYRRALERVSVAADVIHAHCAYPDGLAAVRHGRAIGKPVVITVHGHDIKDLAASASPWRELVAGALEDAAAVIAVSGELGGLVRELGVPEAKLRLIPNGVDCEMFRPGGERQSGEGGWRLLYVGRFDAAKGIGVLLEAAARLRRSGRDVRVTCVGGNATTGTGQPFRDQARDLGLEQLVDFVDEVPWGELPGYMQQADVFVLPSFSEGLPLVLLEAMACGLPVVSTRCGGPQEVVEDAIGELVAVGDAADLERGIGAVLDGYGTYDRAAIRDCARQRYAYPRVAERIRAVYDEVIGAS